MSGASAAGGMAMTGGTTAIGGATTVVGTSPAGGIANVGGAAAAGGSASTGGASSVGVSLSTGGATAVGSATTGGIASTGGASTVGGSPSTGGATAIGGVTTAAGTSSTGGSVSTGATTAVGGASSAGGTDAAGGSDASGGANTTGGTPPHTGTIGQKCSENGYCQSDHCVDGVCCESDCAEQCKVCNLEGQPGHCVAKTCPATQGCNINTDGKCGPLVYTQVAVSDTFTCAVVSDGTVRCWGSNLYGQLGLAGTGDRGVPFLVPGRQNVRSVATGYGFTCTLLWTGQVDCWGVNFHGTLGCDSPAASDIGPLCTPYPSGSKVSELIAGGELPCARLEDGTVQCWGRNEYGQVGNGTNGHAFQPSTVINVANATAIASGVWRACAVIDNKTVKCWGNNVEGNLGNCTNENSDVGVPVYGIDGISSTAASVSLSSDHTCVLMGDASIRCFGMDDAGQLGDGGGGQSWCPVISMYPTTPALSINVGDYFTCAQVGDDSVQCWGSGDHGELGDGFFGGSTSPVTVALPDGVSIVSLATKYSHVCALSSAGRLWCWGWNANGQLGIGNNNDSAMPMEVAPPSNN